MYVVRIFMNQTLNIGGTQKRKYISRKMIRIYLCKCIKGKLSEQLILLLTWSEVTYLNQMGTFFKILSATLEEVLRHQLLGINFRAGGTRV